MSRKAILIITCAILLWYASGLLNEAMAQAQDRLEKTQSFWVRTWNNLQEHPIYFSIIIVAFVTVFSTVMAMLKKDKLLKGLSGHLVTIELKGSQPGSDGERHRGRLRIESEGLEVVEEKANKSNEKVSYLIRKDEYSKVHALVRYHDFLTDREKEERKAEVERVYHPSISMRLRRRIRNIINVMKRVASETFSLAFGTISSKFKVEKKYVGELEKAGQETIGYVTEAAYDTLIDRLIGTRVVLYIKSKLEYVGVLKDYTSQFIELLDVRYVNKWQILMERGHSSRHQRGLTLRKDGDDIVIQSKSPFKVTLQHIYWKEDRADAKREKINKTIEPFGELRFNLMPPSLDIVVGPFERLQLPTRYHYQNYKKIYFHFQSVRVADIVLLKNYGLVRHRTEKYEPKLLDFSALTDALLTGQGEELVLEGNPSATPLTIHNGYLTNLPTERMDIVAVDQQISQRWTVDSAFITLDKKLRPISSWDFLKFLPWSKPRRIIALLALIVDINSNGDRKRKSYLPFIYYTLCNADRKKRRRKYENQVLIKKKKRYLRKFFPRHSQA